jgi:succinyl-CoA synthetase beta subunit
MHELSPSTGPGEIIRKAVLAKHPALTEPETKAILKSIGMEIPDGGVAESPEEAEAIARKLTAPLVVKVVDRLITHKTDIGGIVFPVSDPGDVGDACVRIRNNLIANGLNTSSVSYLVETFSPQETECILGLRMDPAFGAVVVFGLGGVFVEVLRKVAFRLAPLNATDISALLEESGALRLFRGLRGVEAVDVPALEETIAAFAGLTLIPEVVKHIAEIEINPLGAGSSGCIALDAVAILSKRNRKETKE